MVAGGVRFIESAGRYEYALNTAEIYTIATNTWR